MTRMGGRRGVRPGVPGSRKQMVVTGARRGGSSSEDEEEEEKVWDRGFF